MSIIFGFVGLLIARPLLGAIMVPIKLLCVEDVVGGDSLPGGGLGDDPDARIIGEGASCRAY
jgi:hypothetical protein